MITGEPSGILRLVPIPTPCGYHFGQRRHTFPHIALREKKSAPDMYVTYLAAPRLVAGVVVTLCTKYHTTAILRSKLSVRPTRLTHTGV